VKKQKHGPGRCVFSLPDFKYAVWLPIRLTSFMRFVGWDLFKVMNFRHPKNGMSLHQPKSMPTNGASRHVTFTMMGSWDFCCDFWDHQTWGWSDDWKQIAKFVPNLFA